MNLYFFQHVPYETPGHITEWARTKGHNCHFVNFWENSVLPELNLVDGLVVMGGPMNVGDDADEYSWLEAECDYIKSCIKSGKHVLGICLGSQMIADVLGAVVKKNEHTEIGWHKVRVDQTKIPANFSGIFPDEFITFHWHSYTFDIPEHATGFITSYATKNQAFIHKNVAAFQFHPEMTMEGITKLVEQNENVFENGYPFIQPRKNLLNGAYNIETNKSILYKFLDKFFNEK